MTETPDLVSPMCDPTAETAVAAAAGVAATAVPGQEAATEPGSPPRPSAASRGLRRLWREWIRPLGLVLVIMGSFRSAFADWNDVPTGSMKPTIVEGDRIFVNKLAYDLKVPFSCALGCIHLLEWGEPARGEIVVLFSPDDGKRLVKRVVGVPGDRVEVRGGRVLINGRRLHYEPLDLSGLGALDPDERSRFEFAREELGASGHAVMIGDPPGLRDDYGPVTVPPGRYFVMGDNRSQSRDSRFFSFVERQRIVGRATAVVLSLDREHRYRPRWGRFFQSLD
jgi:signal peptidase I